MKLITELNENLQIIKEESQEGKASKLFISGPFIQTEVTNRNNRRYMKETVAREVQRYTENYIDKGRAMGELGHPNGPSINLDRVCIKITELKETGNDFIGKALVLETPMGQIVKNLIDGGVQVGVSTRGLGSVKEIDGINVVQDDFYLATAADVVADPSAPDAYVNGVMEGVDWVWDNGIIKTRTVEAHKKIIKETPKADLSEAKLRVFQHFLSKL
jgi:Prohead core protein serine protease